MAYLYGDSSPSPLTGNFLELLRDALDYSVHLVNASHRLDVAQESAEAHRQAADVELRRLDALEELVRRALAGATVGAADSPTARCVAGIDRAASERASAERDAVRAKLAREVERIDGEVAQEREACVRALETLVKKHDLPGAESAVTVRATPEGERYEALLHQAANYGLGATMELEVPANSPLAHVLRLDRVVERVEVSAPDLSGWLQKKVKLRPQRLEKYYLVGLSVRAGETQLRLRSEATGAGDGFDILVTGAAPGRVRLTRIGQQGDTVGDALDYDPGDADATRIVELRDKLAALAADLLTHRRALRDAEFEGKPARDCDVPSRIAERLVGAMAPVVHEIARHSQSPNELVLKRLLGDDRREELFISRKELRAKIEQVPESARALFDPLGLGDPSAPRISAAPATPATPSVPARAPVPTPAPTPAASATASTPPGMSVRPPPPGVPRAPTLPPPAPMRAATVPPRAPTVPPPPRMTNSIRPPEPSAPAIAINDTSLELMVDDEGVTREDSVEISLAPEGEPSGSLPPPPSPPRKAR